MCIILLWRIPWFYHDKVSSPAVSSVCLCFRCFVVLVLFLSACLSILFVCGMKTREEELCMSAYKNDLIVYVCVCDRVVRGGTNVDCPFKYKRDEG